METIFLHHAENWRILVYLVIFLGMVLEGEIILFSAFFLVHQGNLDFFDVLAIAYIGVIIGDILWYRFGNFFLKTFPHLEKYVSKLTGYLDNELDKNPRRTIFLSKFIFGTHRATLIRAGARKIPFNSFLSGDIVASLCWIAAVAVFAYVTSFSLTLFKHYVRFIEISLLIGIVVFS